ncbi:NAD(P)H quinone oxidoreductase [Sphingobium jiangsuense]|uniref:Putative PIG3 family NAD(P)H quinone oxidoreductase n=1 Tax=Sphingobium jiangsuense TaxID=870476 RepID=A0A7W6BTC4_9SPHN|nr:NAD(P)H-quinone oxidoreductase [Sphingobium jiangsuense]MBB3928403.1 putative PIG3 family NAD(P)H quinone oxidoreductase [Sphingobium jiangsuense]GLS99782.1 NAD(P)H quinone oxidoreductase [Sphingobium jiangsuense]
MRAITIEGGKGPAEALKITEAPRPVPQPHEILIRVAAAGVNRPDIAQREGNYPPPPGASDILGLEVAGTVVKVGAAVSHWQAGDRVCALLPGGGYAEYTVVDARHALPVPEGLSLEQAAGLPETVFTVFTNLFERGRLKAGETALIHGANSGIGVTAIAMAKAAGARVFVTARGEAKCATAVRLGADLAIDVTSEDFAQVVKDNGGADVVLDIIGGDYFNCNIDALNEDGRLVQIATLGGNIVETDLLRFMFKRLTLCASTLRGRPAAEKARLTAAIREQAWPWVEQGKVQIPIDRRFPLEEAAQAHKWLEQGQQFGKVVLTVDP